MRFDVAQPILNEDSSRDEILLVPFEGFIKNSSEGILRTMLRDIDDWVLKYPEIRDYEGIPMEDLYENVMLLQPSEMLFFLANGERKIEDVEMDLIQLQKDTILSNSKITSFEYALYQLLETSIVKKCYIFKNGIFYDNEISYIEDRYEKNYSKIQLLDGMPFHTAFHKVNPTTIFLYDPSFVFDYVKNNVSDDDANAKMFIILNSLHTVEDLGNGNFKYTEQFQESMNLINQTKPYGVTTLFNFQLDEPSEDGDEEDKDNDVPKG